MDYYYIRDLLSCIYKNFPVKNTAEITIEINPNNADRNKIREYILAGVNRFSIGLQSTNPKILKDMGRAHKAADFEKVVKMIREFGVRNISADIIIGYPKQKMVDVKETLNYLMKMEIPHISTYMLQVEEGTPLKCLVDKGAVGVPDDDLVVDMYKY
jgi:oxygen-independent coproporphyrinogen-3 oxidase